VFDERERYRYGERHGVTMMPPILDPTIGIKSRNATGRPRNTAYGMPRVSATPTFQRRR